jgi:two-component system, OmpR family, sensor kinase
MRSFRLTLAFRTAGGVLALMLLLAIISAVALRALLYRQLDGTLVHLAEVEAEAGAAQMGSAFQFHEGVLLSTGGGAGAELTRYAELWTSDGAPAARSANLDRDLFLPADAREAAHDGRIVWDTHVWEGQRLRCVVYPLRLVGAAHGQHLLQVAAPLAPLDRTLRDFILSELLLSLLACGGAFLVGWQIAGAALRPTREITEQAEAIREGTPAPTITAHADAMEFSRLVQVLNGMLGRLDRAFAIQRRFTADASHELRGPLTALRGELDLALKRPRGPDEYQATLQRCRAEVIRLSHLATDLLTLARNEAGLNAQERVDTDLRVIAERVLDRFRSAAEARGVRLAVTGEAAIVKGDPGMLERVVSNLVDNAVKHVPEAGAVEVAVAAGNPTTLTVKDTGGGIASADRPHLFSRFFRGEATSATGTGLGLAIARSAAEAHGGSLEFLGNDPGAVFQLRLPASGPL